MLRVCLVNYDEKNKLVDSGSTALAAALYVVYDVRSLKVGQLYHHMNNHFLARVHTVNQSPIQKQRFYGGARVKTNIIPAHI